MQQRSPLFRLLSLFILVLCVGGPVHAHPHNWIDLNTTFVLDKQSRLTHVKQRWEFDMYYSLMTHADVLNEFENEEKGLPETARRMIQSLKNYDYFSTLTLDGREMNLGVPSEYELVKKHRDGQMFLELEMVFEVSPSFAVELKTLALSVFDPTYYIAMNHQSDHNISIITDSATECSKELEVPNPSDDLIEYAQSLDRNQKNTDGLGASFAQTVFIKCI